MNDNDRARPPQPGPACEYFAPLLPLVGQERLNPRDSSRLRQHLATCRYCQGELDSYTWLDDTLARYFGPATRGPLSPGDIRELTSRAYRPRIDLSEPAPAPAALSNHRQPRPPAAFRPTRPQSAHHGRRVISILSAMAAVLVIGSLGLAFVASGAHLFTSNQKKPTVPVATLPTYIPNDHDLFENLAMVSPNEGWIIGNNYPSYLPGAPLIIHYLNGHLYKVNNLALQGAKIDTVSMSQVGMLSATEGWAMGTYQATANCNSTLFLRYTGGRWKQDSIIAGTTFTSIALTSPTNGWAVGIHDTACSQGAETPSLLYYYDGTTWTPESVPPGIDSLSQVVMTSATNGWATGTKQGNGNDSLLLLHYDGKTWIEVNIPGLSQIGKNLVFGPIALTSATDGWMVVKSLLASAIPALASYAAEVAQSVLFHYDGSQWTRTNTVLDTVQPANVTSLSLAPDGSGWLVGIESDVLTFFLRFNSGIWSQDAGPAKADSAQVFTVSANDAWAVSNAAGHFLLHYHNGAWQTVSISTLPSSTATPTTTVTTPCASHEPPLGAGNTPGATVTPIALANWEPYANTTYHYQVSFPTNWAVDNLACPDAKSITFWNYEDTAWSGPGLPDGGIKIELDAEDNPNGLSPTAFFQMEAQNTAGGPSCTNYATRTLQVGRHDAVEATCPGQTTDIYYIADGASMLRIAQATGANVSSSDVLTNMISSFTFI